MLYKTIVLELLQQHPQTYDQLLENRTLLQTLNLYASQLKECHEAWKERLAQANPGTNESPIASAALELALKELEDSLPNGSLPDDSEAFSLDAAMAYIRPMSPE